MIHYHGLPITPETVAVKAVEAGHAFVSFRHSQQLGTAAAVSQSFAIDNGAFSAWKDGNPVQDWRPFYDWAAQCKLIPSCDFAVIPDVIDGDEAANDELLASMIFPLLAFGSFMPLIVLGQFLAKVAGGAVWAWTMNRFSTLEAA